MAGKTKAKSRTFKLNGSILTQVAANMLPFYLKIAGNQAYALRWSKAVRQGDLDTLIAMFKAVARRTQLDGFSTNAIGYFIAFAFPAPVIQYSNATTIPPGSTQFTFSTPIHRAIARAVLPFYSSLAGSRAYASALAAAIHANDISRVGRLVRQKVKSNALQSVRIDYSGVAIYFNYKSSKFMYRNVLFREIVV